MGDGRKTAVQIVFVLVALVFLGKLFYLQIVDTTYKELAAANSLQRQIDYPYRGVIYDRHNKILVYNVPVYDVMVTPKDLAPHMDTAALAGALGVDMAYARQKLREARTFSRVKASVFLKQLSQEDFARIQDQLVDFAGFFINPRTVRNYPHTSSANALGYIGEISSKKLEKLQGEGDRFYKSGDYIGITGLESFYENDLRGKRGVKYILVDVHGVQHGSFKNGAYDTTAIRGENLHSSLDLELQKLGDTLLQNKTGSIVAIEPSTGEILCMVSSPSYDPNLLTGREFSKNYQKLALDPSKPLFNRASQAMYRPGSTFKIVQSLIGMQEGTLTPETVIACHTSPMHCHPHPSPQKLTGAIIYSCNSYFFHVFKRLVNKGVSSSPFIDTRVGLAEWNKYVDAFGFGHRLGVDIPNEKRGMVPSVKLYDKMYGEKRWKFSTIYSVSIGEGEYSVDPIQMANFAATIANRGYWYVPHFVHAIGEKGYIPKEYTTRHETGVAPEHYEYIAGAMEQVILAGMTVWKRGVVMDSVTIAGKTGTSQNAKGKDHSIFIGFAPIQKPKIAIAAFIENAGFGGYAAAPIASLIIERYIKGRTVRKNLKQFMTDKEYLTPIERAARQAMRLQDSLRRMDTTQHRLSPIRVLPVQDGHLSPDSAAKRLPARKTPIAQLPTGVRMAVDRPKEIRVVKAGG